MGRAKISQISGRQMPKCAKIIPAEGGAFHNWGWGIPPALDLCVVGGEWCPAVFRLVKSSNF
jgi:hypothetical protein